MAETYTGPVPKPTPESAPYWLAAREGRLLIQRCDDCGRHFFYPRPLCPHCLSRAVRWVEASGKGTLHTFSINHRAPRGFPAKGPYVVGIVELEEGPRMMTNIVGVEPDPTKLRCDMPVEVVFEPITAEITLAKFRPREG
jgi:uncharacterized OB-fold protein